MWSVSVTQKELIGKNEVIELNMMLTDFKKLAKEKKLPFLMPKQILTNLFPAGGSSAWGLMSLGCHRDKKSH